MISNIKILIIQPVTLLALGILIGLPSTSSAEEEIKELVIKGGGKHVKLRGKITFVATSSGHKEIYICNADGSDVYRITTDS